MELLKSNLGVWFPYLRVITVGHEDRPEERLDHYLTMSVRHPKWLYLIPKSCDNTSLFRQAIPIHVIVQQAPNALAIARGNNFFFNIDAPPGELTWKNFLKTGLRCVVCGSCNGRTGFCLSCGACTCHTCFATRREVACKQCGQPLKSTERVTSNKEPVGVSLDVSTCRTALRGKLEVFMKDVSFALAEIHAYRGCAGSVRQGFFNLDMGRIDVFKRHPQPHDPRWASEPYPIQPLTFPMRARDELPRTVECAQTPATWGRIVAYVEARPKSRFGVVVSHASVLYILWVKELAPRRLLVGACVRCSTCSGEGQSLRWCKVCRAAAFCSASCAEKGHGCAEFLRGTSAAGVASQLATSYESVGASS
jgi:hypothetical protein